MTADFYYGRDCSSQIVCLNYLRPGATDLSSAANYSKDVIEQNKFCSETKHIYNLFACNNVLIIALERV